MADVTLAAGMVVGETWEIVEPLGRGGMGEVWLANHRRVSGKQAAIKVLRLGAEGPDLLKRFQREAEIAARLEHPNIVQVFDYATLADGAPYLVMELLRGESLGHRLRRGPMRWAELEPLVVQIGSALHAAHAAGVVHRDLKPENLFLVETPTGVQVKVLDFGISKIIGSDTLQTRDSVLIGTPQYMSPEQANADHGNVGGQSDVFSLATICFEALTGERPFAGASLARVIYNVAFGPSPSLREKDLELPEHVFAAIDHALEKSLEARTPDVATFVRECTGVTLGSVAVRAAELPVEPPVATPKPTVSLRTPPASPHAPAGATVTSPREARPTRGGGGLGIALGAAALLMIGFGAVSVLSRPAEATAPADAGQAVLVSVPALDAGMVVEPVTTAVPDTVVDAGRSLERPRVTAKLASLTPQQEELLAGARSAFSREAWPEVVSWCSKPAIVDRPEAITLRVLSWCHLGNLGLVNAYKAKLPTSERASVLRTCRQLGVEFD